MLEKINETLLPHYDNLLYVLFLVAGLFIYVSKVTFTFKAIATVFVGVMVLLTNAKDSEPVRLAPPPPPEQQEDNLTEWAQK